MAHLRCDFFSEALSLNHLDDSRAPGGPRPRSAWRATPRTVHTVLYLLHGLSDDDTIWLRRTSIERYAAPLSAVVMPQVHRSFYTDQAYGRYWTFLTELRASSDRCSGCRTAERTPSSRACRWADTPAPSSGRSGTPSASRQPRACPGRWTSPASARAGPAPRTKLVERIWGNQTVAGGPDDLLALLRQADAASLPALGVWCGTEDVVFEDSVVFRDAAAAARVPLTVDFGPGAHDWAYWDAKIRAILAWLPLESRP